MDLDHTDAYLFDLPEQQIAAHPRARRDASRLLVLGDETTDHVFGDLETLLQPGDVLVVNDAKVSPVRLHGHRESGGNVEVFVLGFEDEGRWGPAATVLTALTRSNRRLKAGEVVTLTSGDRLTLDHRDDAGRAHFVCEEDAWGLLDRAGGMPLPPYIEKRRRALGEAVAQAEDATRYQTRYARTPGAVAAPTAGLHFSDTLLTKLEAMGVHRVPVTLYVGAGTFKPVKPGALADHTMHVEYYDVPAATAEAVAQAQTEGRRVVAVGTTVVRTLEAAYRDGTVQAGPGSTALFIRPGYRFRVIDALITNFHLPASTLLALVAAFGGYERVMAAYARAVRSGYRFYSYGDAMLIPNRAEG